MAQIVEQRVHPAANHKLGAVVEEDGAGEQPERRLVSEIVELRAVWQWGEVH